MDNWQSLESVINDIMTNLPHSQNNDAQDKINLASCKDGGNMVSSATIQGD